MEKETSKGIEKTKIPLTQSQAWTAYNEAQTNEVRMFDELLKDPVQNIEEPNQHMGRPRLSLRETAERPHFARYKRCILSFRVGEPNRCL
ncbi:MAG: hypothetical protein PHD13_07370 [Methanocellales archaeon]|nr:hypothetical protein [Methanocellales archaeon]MDD3292169.1 hypothetical protein [Methanocellales archaeon]MDD5235977.1 hypothetical protein [Methanocellales archaeon]MDD5485646.1 hypothetical protein [Methanocellales archaeon]